MSGPSIEAYPPGPNVSLDQTAEPTKTISVPFQLAANLMPLCGIPNPARGDGETRALSLSELNLATVAQGAPSSVKKHELVENAHIIRNASLQRFGPNTVMASVLTGANYLFEPLAAAHERALNQPLFDGLSQRMSFGITACWAFQMFREQPGLFMTGGQAWRAQRTLIHDTLVPMREPEPNKFAPPQPDTFAPLRKLVGWGEDVFFDSCRDVTRERSTLVMATDLVSGHTVPKIYAHPGDFTERFLRSIGMMPGPRERLSAPIVPESSDMAVLTAAWAANDLTARAPHENELAPACREANEEIRFRVTQLVGMRISL